MHTSICWCARVRVCPFNPGTYAFLTSDLLQVSVGWECGSSRVDGCGCHPGLLTLCGKTQPWALLPPLVSGGSTGRRYEKRQCGIAGRMSQCVCRVRVVQRCELTRSHDSCQTRPRLGACEIYYVRSGEDFADMQHRNCM